MNYYCNKNIIKVKNTLIKDQRGGMFKYFNKKYLKKLSIPFEIKETQISYNKSKNIFRGFYMQTGKYNEAKLISLIEGKAFWFAIDLRFGSKHFGKVQAFKLSNDFTLYIPRGFAHGSFSISESKILIFADNLYNLKNSIGINYKDKELKYKNFNLKNKRLTISKNHKNFPLLEDNLKKIKHFYIFK